MKMVPCGVSPSSHWMMLICLLKKYPLGDFPDDPVVKIHLVMQGTEVRSLGWGGATQPVCHNPWAPKSQLLKADCPTAHGLQREKPLQKEARTVQPKSSPHSLQLEKAWAQQWRPNAAKSLYINIFLNNPSVVDGDSRQETLKMELPSKNAPEWASVL